MADFNAGTIDAIEKMHEKIGGALCRHFLALSEVWDIQTKRR
jgi:hypothetical protein